MLALVGSLPLQAPDAVQEVALPADHVSVALWPATMVVGSSLSEMVGAGAGGPMLLPPYPPQEDNNTAAAGGTRRARRRAGVTPRSGRMTYLPYADCAGRASLCWVSCQYVGDGRASVLTSALRNGETCYLGTGNVCATRFSCKQS